jgi:hypothetical protein
MYWVATTTLHSPAASALKNEIFTPWVQATFRRWGPRWVILLLVCFDLPLLHYVRPQRHGEPPCLTHSELIFLRMSLVVHMLLPILLLCNWTWRWFNGERRRDQESTELSRRAPIRLISVVQEDRSQLSTRQNGFFDLGGLSFSSRRSSVVPHVDINQVNHTAQLQFLPIQGFEVGTTSISTMDALEGGATTPKTDALGEQQRLLRHFEDHAQQVRREIARLTNQQSGLNGVESDPSMESLSFMSDSSVDVIGQTNRSTSSPVGDTRAMGEV